MFVHSGIRTQTRQPQVTSLPDPRSHISIVMIDKSKVHNMRSIVRSVNNLILF